MSLGVAEGRFDLAILPADIRLPDAVSAASVGTLQWRCFARRGHPAFRFVGTQGVGSVASHRRARR